MALPEGVDFFLAVGMRAVQRRVHLCTIFALISRNSYFLSFASVALVVPITILHVRLVGWTIVKCLSDQLSRMNRMNHLEEKGDYLLSITPNWEGTGNKQISGCLLRSVAKANKRTLIPVS